MCEIVVINPEDVRNEDIHQLAATLSEEQGDGFGILGVAVGDDGKFRYSAYRDLDPDWMRLHQFLERNNEETWRYILHGRAKTTGEVSRDHAHPLPVDCPECEPIKWVVHNGSVRNYDQNRASLISAGHEFETGVDSEIIPHKVSGLPDSISDHDDHTYNISGNLNYFVCTEDGILARLSRKYYVSEDFTVSCSNRRRESEAIDYTYQEMDNGDEWFRVTAATEADDATVLIERKERERTTGRSYNRYGSNSGREDYTDSTTNHQQSDDEQQSSVTATKNGDSKVYYSRHKESVTEVYDDLVPHIDEVVAYKVAPGVIKVVDLEAETDDIEYVFRDERPKLYYYYERDEHEKLNQFFDEDGDLVPAENLAGLAQLFPELDEAAEQQTLDGVEEDVEGDTGTADTNDDGRREVDGDPFAPALLDTLSKEPSQMKPPDVAFLEMVAMYGSEEAARQEMERMDTEQIENVAKNAVHVPKMN